MSALNIRHPCLSALIVGASAHRCSIARPGRSIMASFLLRNLSSTRFAPKQQVADSDSGAAALAQNKAPTIRRFWRNVGVEERDGALAVVLDNRPIKTPDGQQIRIAPSQSILAWLVAGEWEAQREFLGSHSLPLTSLVCRAIDGLADQQVRIDVIDELIKYFHTDSACLHEHFPQSLVDLQLKHYMPIVSWARETYGIDIAVTDNIFALRQSSQAADELRRVVSLFCPLKLAAFEKAVMTAKSFLIGLALVEQRITAEQAAAAAQVETSAQTQLWGELENAHDIDNAAIRQILGASACASIGA
ncbi:chaperone [Coemansia asiatica]|uniref:Chaperone n=1 Tax=Coemansia asiatica TaxID=1052880 RepID=A0A9W7XKF1_9FUNG|nr:chaperone [Coemansia asiatica]KAJ2865717.1 chaperone [Coemansia asiatica]